MIDETGCEEYKLWQLLHKMKFLHISSTWETSIKVWLDKNFSEAVTTQTLTDLVAAAAAAAAAAYYSNSKFLQF